MHFQYLSIWKFCSVDAPKSTLRNKIILTKTICCHLQVCNRIFSCWYWVFSPLTCKNTSKAFVPSRLVAFRRGRLKSDFRSWWADFLLWSLFQYCIDQQFKEKWPPLEITLFGYEQTGIHSNFRIFHIIWPFTFGDFSDVLILFSNTV